MIRPTQFKKFVRPVLRTPISLVSPNLATRLPFFATPLSAPRLSNFNCVQIRHNSSSTNFNNNSPYPGPGPTEPSSKEGKLRLEYLLLQLEHDSNLKERMLEFLDILFKKTNQYYGEVKHDHDILSKILPWSLNKFRVLLKLMFDTELTKSWSDVVQYMEGEKLPINWPDMMLVGNYFADLVEIREIKPK